jgi:hypothetical protein
MPLPLRGGQVKIGSTWLPGPPAWTQVCRSGPALFASGRSMWCFDTHLQDRYSSPG